MGDALDEERERKQQLAGVRRCSSHVRLPLLAARYAGACTAMTWACCCQLLRCTLHPLLSSASAAPGCGGNVCQGVIPGAH